MQEPALASVFVSQSPDVRHGTDTNEYLDKNRVLLGHLYVTAHPCCLMLTWWLSSSRIIFSCSYSGATKSPCTWDAHNSRTFPDFQSYTMPPLGGTGGGEKQAEAVTKRHHFSYELPAKNYNSPRLTNRSIILMLHLEEFCYAVPWGQHTDFQLQKCLKKTLSTYKMVEMCVSSISLIF